MALKALASDQDAAEVLSISKCLRCSWASKLLEDYPFVEGLRGDKCQAKLRAIAAMSSIDISALEALRATTRRRLMSKGIQAPGPSFDEVSAEFVCDRLRERGS